MKRVESAEKTKGINRDNNLEILHREVREYYMFIKIGSIDFTRSIQAQYTVQSFSESSIGIRGHVQSEVDLKTTEEKLYLLRDGRIEEVEIQTDDGKVWRGLYKINELTWRKERKIDNTYELSFNIGLQKQASSSQSNNEE